MAAAVTEYHWVLQEESERLCGRHLPDEIVRMILYKWGGLQTPAAAAIRKRMETPLFAGRHNTCLVPFGDINADPRDRGWVEGVLATEPERPAYDISMVLDSRRFMFPCCGQKLLMDGRIAIWKVVRVPKSANPPVVSWIVWHPVTYWEVAAIVSFVAHSALGYGLFRVLIELLRQILPIEKA